MNQEALVDFCKVLDKVPGAKQLNIAEGYLYTVAPNFVVRMPIDLNLCVAWGVSGFSTLIKRFSSGAVDFSVFGSKLRVKQGSREATFALIEELAGKMSPEVEPLDDTQLLLGSIVKAQMSIGQSPRFSGILVTAGYTTKFSDLSIRVVFHGKNWGRFVVSPEMAAILSVGAVSSVGLGKAYFGIRLSSGVEVFGTLLHDNYPEDCVSPLGLTPSGVEFGEKVVISKDDLLFAVQTVDAVSKTPQVRFEEVGLSEEGRPVWQLSGDSGTGTVISELVEGEGALFRCEPFCLPVKKLVDGLVSLRDDVAVLTVNKSAVFVSDTTGTDVCVLSKSYTA